MYAVDSDGILYPDEVGAQDYYKEYICNRASWAKLKVANPRKNKIQEPAQDTRT